MKAVLFSKCDRCGDQVYAHNIFLKSLLNADIKVYHITLSTNNFLEKLHEGSFLYSYDFSISLEKNIDYFNIISKKTNYLIIISPFDPFVHCDDKILISKKQKWIKFLSSLSCNIAICGTLDPKWVDVLNCNLINSECKRIGLIENHRIQSFPEMFIEYSDITDFDITFIPEKEFMPEKILFETILKDIKIEAPHQVSCSSKETRHISFFVGASSLQKQYPFNQIFKIATDLKSRLPCHISFVYGPNEYQLYLKSKSLPGIEHIYFSSDNFLSLISFLKDINVAYTHDTFYYHLLSYFGIANVVIVGGGHWKRFIYNCNYSSVITNRLPCFGCNWDCSYKSPFCIIDINCSSILKILEDRILNICSGFKVYHSNSLTSCIEITENYANDRKCNNYINEENIKSSKGFVKNLVQERDHLSHNLSSLICSNKELSIENELLKRNIHIYTKLIENKQNFLE